MHLQGAEERNGVCKMAECPLQRMLLKVVLDRKARGWQVPPRAQGACRPAPTVPYVKATIGALAELRRAGGGLEEGLRERLRTDGSLADGARSRCASWESLLASAAPTYSAWPWASGWACTAGRDSAVCTTYGRGPVATPGVRSAASISMACTCRQGVL